MAKARDVSARYRAVRRLAALPNAARQAWRIVSPAARQADAREAATMRRMLRTSAEGFLTADDERAFQDFVRAATEARRESESEATLLNLR